MGGDDEGNKDEDKDDEDDDDGEGDNNVAAANPVETITTDDDGDGDEDELLAELGDNTAAAADASVFKSAKLKLVVSPPSPPSSCTNNPSGTTSIASSLLQNPHAVSLSPKYGSPPK